MRRAGAVIVGVGGLGAPAAAALAAAGIERLGLIDPDVVELSNLPRQPTYGEDDLGQPKVEIAARRIRQRFPDLRVEAACARVDDDSFHRLLDGYAVILDGTDGLPSKVLLNDAALALDVPLVHAGAVGLDGQLFTILPNRSACLRCLFPELPDEDDLATCQQSGILGPVVGLVGLAAAREATAILAQRPPRLADRLAILDATRLRWRTIGLRPSPRCPACHASGAPART